MMKRLVLTAAVLIFPALAIGQQGDEVREYNAQKITKQRAETACEILAGINLHPKDHRAITLHTEAETLTIAAPEREGYQIVVTYPYRTDGVRWVCVFRDYRDNALIQLMEYGQYGGGTDDIRIIEPFW